MLSQTSTRLTNTHAFMHAPFKSQYKIIATRTTTHPTTARHNLFQSQSPSICRPLPSKNSIIVSASANISAASSTSSSSSSSSISQLLSTFIVAATNYFPVFVVGAALLGLYSPTSFSWYRPSYITPALGITMLGMGLTLTFEDFRRVLATPRRIFAGFALQYTVMPLMALAVSRLAQLPLDFVIGLCIVGSCPGGTASNVVTYLARADVPLSVAMTTASTLGAVVATPLLTQALLGTLIPVNAAALLFSTLQVVLAPVLVGAAVNSLFPKQVARIAPLSALTAVVLIAVICGATIAQNSAAVLNAGPRLLLAVAALHIGGFGLGYALSKAIGIPETAARTNSIEVGMQNSALGAMLATAHFPAHPLAAVPCAISACMHSMLGSMLAAYWRTQTVSTDENHHSQSSKASSGVEPDAQTRRQHVRMWIAQWRLRTGAPGGPSKWVTAEEVGKFSDEQLKFLERKRQGL